MTNYDFEKLSDKDFERLVTAIASKYIGPGMDIYGAGTDGGREATFKGQMTYPSDAAPWDGYLVLQCKQKESRSASRKEDADWAIAQLDDEMEMYRSAKISRTIPDYFIFATNVELSAKLKSGGKDRFNDRLSYWVNELGMRTAQVWDRDKLSNFLDSNRDIAQRFGYLHDGDLIHAATEMFLAQCTDMKSVLSVFLQEEVRNDQYVNLRQAGHTSEDQPPLSRVFVDLQARTTDQSGRPQKIYVADVVQKATDHSLAYSRLELEKLIAAEEEQASHRSSEDNSYDSSSDEAYQAFQSTSALKKPIWKDPSRFVFVGGPGQGKSTLVQYLAQRHRVALLASAFSNTCEEDVSRAMVSVRTEADEAGCGLPTHARLPFRIVLESFASELADENVASVLDYVALAVATRSGQPFNRKDAEYLLGELPWLVVFDGLDEVPAVSNRQQVIDAIRRFLTEVRTKDADVLVIATTRPQGYSDEFGSSYNHLTLQPLTPDQALAYAKKLVETKYANRVDMRQTVLQRLRTAASEKAIARLMQSPLQVTIMAVLVEIIGKLPRERYVLFQKYYDIIYQREQERGLGLSEVLRLHKTSIEVLHDQIGLQLQIDGESPSSTRQSRISRTELKNIIRQYLVKEGFEDEEVEQIATDFMTIALDRLVFIFPLEAESYGFEVRSLQEFSAARALMRGGYTVVKERLQTIAPVPYWRNTMLFAVGRAFSMDDQYCDMVGQLCTQLNNDESDIILSQTLAGSQLALDILEEGVAEGRPVYRNQFFDCALKLLNTPNILTAKRLSVVYEVKHERRYIAAAQAAVGGEGVDLQLGLLTLLGCLSSRLKGEAEWVVKMLHQLWPTDPKQERFLIEKIGDIMPQNDWFRGVCSQLGRVSDMQWVTNNLGGSTATWISAAHYLIRSRDGRAMLFIEREEGGDGGVDFEYLYPLVDYNKDDLSRISEANPTHTSWLPLLLCQDFLVNPSAATLADALENVAKSPAFVPGQQNFYGVAWQLPLFLNHASSKEELLTWAQRVRNGEIGDIQQWKRAEVRWETSGFDAADFRVFSDEEWPFTTEIAERGIQPLTSYSSSNIVSSSGLSGKALLEAFMTTTSQRARSGLASSFLFLRSCTYDSEAAFPVSLEVIKQLMDCTLWHMDSTMLLSLLEPELDWIGVINELDGLGNCLPSFGLRRPAYYIEEERISEAVDTCIMLLNIRPLREGVLRFVAGLVVSKKYCNTKLRLHVEALSSRSKVAVVAIDIFSEQPQFTAMLLAQYVIELWSFKVNSSDEDGDMIRIIARLTEGERLTERQIELLSILLRSAEIGIDAKHVIAESLIKQAQYRESRLNVFNI